ncbi:ATP-binding cassette domain-containing protein [Evansella tamaricis]|uniref:ABC transporter ATP-binding protein n=1 Tax=Evansella tamaricis TaxID=2069301 RepID=A0ABS6JE50_9BACI|nr:ABC transporter ATP-binding protein [Evansella tamaricis]
MGLIKTVGLTKTYNGTNAVDGIDLSIKEGVCTALLGPNGAGKTTTLNMLTGLINATSGTISFDDRYMGDRRKYIGYLPQYPKFYGWMTGEEYIIFSGQLAGLTKKEALSRSDELLSLVGLSEDKKKRVSGYSGGMKQRLGIAQSLIHSPKLLILDEPVSALDPIGRREVLELMKTLKEKTSILFSTHVLHDAEEICEEIFIIKKGKLIIEGDLVELQRKYQKPTIYLNTEEPIEDWSTTIKQKEWLRHMDVKKNKITVTVEDMDMAREALLTDESLRKLKINSFEVAKTTLEDLFMEVTGK